MGPTMTREMAKRPDLGLLDHLFSPRADRRYIWMMEGRPPLADLEFLTIGTDQLPRGIRRADARRWLSTSFCWGRRRGETSVFASAARALPRRGGARVAAGGS